MRWHRIRRPLCTWRLERVNLVPMVFPRWRTRPSWKEDHGNEVVKEFTNARLTYEMSRVHEVTCARALNYSPTFFHPACTVPGGRRVHAWSWVWQAVSESAVNKVGGDGICDVSSRRSCFVFSVTLSSLNDIPPGSVQIKFLGFFSFFILKKIRLTRERELLFLLILVMTYSK